MAIKYPTKKEKVSQKYKSDYPYKFYCQYWTDKIINDLKIK